MDAPTPRPLSRWIPAIVWAALIFAGSSIPGSGLPATGLAPVAHFIEYAVLGACLSFALGAEPKRLLLVFAAIGLATLFGITDEFHQSFVPGRTPDSMDVLVDFVGASIGSAASIRLLRRSDARKP